MLPEARAAINSLGNKQKLNLCNMGLTDEDTILVSRVLKGSNVKKLYLKKNKIGKEGCMHLSRVLPDTQIEKLYLRDNDIGDEGAKYIGHCLKDSRISVLDLGYNRIGDEGGSCLVQGLEGSQIQTLYVNDNSIGDEVLKVFAQVLKDTQITTFHFQGNQIGYDGARCFNEILCDTKLQNYRLDVITRGGLIRQVMFTSDGVRKFKFRLRLSEIWLEDEVYLKQLFSLIPEVHELRIYPQKMTEKYAQCLAKAIKDLKIYCLFLKASFLYSVEIPSRIKYLILVFRQSQIPKVVVDLELKSSDAQSLAEVLKDISVTELHFGRRTVKEKFISELSLALKTSTLLKLGISENELSSTGMESLVQILRHNPITHLDLRKNVVGDAGAMCLAGVLKYSQLTHIDLSENNISEFGYQHLAEVISDSNVCSVRFFRFPLLDQRNETTTIAYRVSHAFKMLVKFNSCVQEFQFVLPKEMYDSIVDDYAYFIKELIDNPLVKAHIFNLMCSSNPHSFDYVTMDKINKFTEKLCYKFNKFFNDNVLAFSPYDSVEIVKKFENKQLSDVVQNLLLHRALFYVDSNKEILHPFIYRLLHKYKLPLYNEELEPNKKEAIIAFYEKHFEDDEVKELMLLLM